MIESLKDLDERMENKLNLMYGNYIDVIEHMKEKHGINGVYANTDYSPYAKVLLSFGIRNTVLNTAYSHYGVRLSRHQITFSET